MDLFEIVKKQ